LSARRRELKGRRKKRREVTEREDRQELRRGRSDYIMEKVVRLESSGEILGAN